MVYLRSKHLVSKVRRMCLDICHHIIMNNAHKKYAKYMKRKKSLKDMKKQRNIKKVSTKL